MRWTARAAILRGVWQVLLLRQVPEGGSRVMYGMAACEYRYVVEALAGLEADEDDAKSTASSTAPSVALTSDATGRRAGGGGTSGGELHRLVEPRRLHNGGHRAQTSAATGSPNDSRRQQRMVGPTWPRHSGHAVRRVLERYPRPAARPTPPHLTHLRRRSAQRRQRAVE